MDLEDPSRLEGVDGDTSPGTSRKIDVLVSDTCFPFI
jgi:hypothetical protein